MKNLKTRSGQMEVLVAQVVKTLAASIASCGVLIAWFNTDMLVSYIKLFRLSKLTYLKEYEEFLFESPDSKTTFLQFSYIKEPTFINKLLSCPYCFCFWISLICSFIATTNPLLVFVCYPISLVLYLTFIKIFKSSDIVFQYSHQLPLFVQRYVLSGQN